MEAAREIAGDKVGGATGEDHAAQLGDLEDGLRDAVLQFPEGRMQADDFADHPLDLGDAVLRQVGREMLRQVVGGEGMGEQVFVEKHPAAALLAHVLIEEGQELLAQGGGTRAGFAGDGEERMTGGAERNVGLATGGLVPRLEDGQTVVEVGMRGHGGV